MLNTLYVNQEKEANYNHKILDFKMRYSVEYSKNSRRNIIYYFVFLFALFINYVMLSQLNCMYKDAYVKITNKFMLFISFVLERPVLANNRSCNSKTFCINEI
jgi:hypothetical protein